MEGPEGGEIGIRETERGFQRGGHAEETFEGETETDAGEEQRGQRTEETLGEPAPGAETVSAERTWSNWAAS